MGAAGIRCAGIGLLGCLLLLAACAENGTMPQQAAEPVAPIADPVVAFTAAASPGAEDTVLLPGTGQTARVRLVRAYAAASGRECREVMVGTGGGGSSRLLCRAGEGWREARPLIGSASGRP
jgi:hypothetical protein